MREQHWYIALGIGGIALLICFIPLPLWMILGLAGAVMYPFSTIVLKSNIETASILSAFLFCTMACTSHHAISVLVGYTAYILSPLFLLRYQFVHYREFSQSLFVEALKLVLPMITSLVALWWVESQACAQGPLWLKIWPGCATLVSGAYTTGLFMYHHRHPEPALSFHVTFKDYAWLAVMLFMAITLEGTQALFVNMTITALLPFTLETILKMWSKWGMTSRTIFFILMGCATITILPLYLFGLYAVFSPWINHCFKKGVK